MYTKTVHDVINRHIIEEACSALQTSEKIKAIEG